MTTAPPDVALLARLARLRLSREEAQRMAEELRAIIDHLSVLPSSGEAPTPEAPAAGAPLRPDVVGPDSLLDPLEAIAPEWADGYFRVPSPPGLGSPGEE